MHKRLAMVVALSISATALAEPAPDLRREVEAVLATAPAGTRFGLLAVDGDGHEVLAIAPDQRFIPASNTKLFTTAAAYEVLGRDLHSYEVEGATSLGLHGNANGIPDVLLTGGGVSLSTAPDCKQRCLSRLIDKLGPNISRVHDIIADDSNFVDQRWSPGMSWNNMGTDSGTAVSALIVDDNEVPLVVVPAAAGQPPTIMVSSYFTVRNDAMTVASGETRLTVEHPVNGRELRLVGTIGTGTQPWRERLGIDDPADYAGWSVKQALETHGVKVEGKVRLLHRAVQSSAVPAYQPPGYHFSYAGMITAAPLAEEVATINKRSQNLHAEAMLRRIGLARGSQDVFATQPAQYGSREAGLAAMRRVLEQAGIPRAGYDFSDGSGMSTYNRVSPRAAVALLRWGATRPWGAEWRASLPVAGVDGTLKRRFAGTPLQGKLWAKTGSINATNALSGWLRTASGRELTFSIFANDVPDGTSALAAMDAALLLIASRN